MNLLFKLWFVLALLSAPLVHALSAAEARHLLHRTGYGVTVSEWAQVIDLEYDAAVDLLVDAATGAAPPSVPEWVSGVPLSTRVQRDLSEDERKTLRQQKRAQINSLREWWLHQMVLTPTPLRERMTMFWSNHFTTEFKKIMAPSLIAKQHMMLRQHALGSFAAMLHEIIRDPAMLRYLDNDKNYRNSVNENLARELLELFTLGEGNYTEADVKEAARCLTGWGVDRRTGKFNLNLMRHDNDAKKVLGQTGKFDADDLLDILLERPETARHIVTRLWREFISLQPDQRQVNSWAREYQASGYRTDLLLKTIFKSPQFRDPANYGGLVKSPTELYAGLVRPALDGLSQEARIIRLASSRAAGRLPAFARGAGQHLFDPPNVKGWAGGLKWIDSKTLLMREQAARNLVGSLTADRMNNETEVNGNPYARSLGPGHDALQSTIWMLTALDPLTEIPGNMAARRALLLVVRDPVIHLK